MLISGRATGVTASRTVFSCSMRRARKISPRWLYTVFRKNMAYDQFVRRLLTDSGNMYDFTRGTSYYPLIKKPEDMAAVTSQLFLGVKIECARCHNHPFERWTRSDFRGMAAFFSQIRYKNSGPRHNEYILYLDFQRQFEDPDTK